MTCRRERLRLEAECGQSERRSNNNQNIKSSSDDLYVKVQTTDGPVLSLNVSIERCFIERTL